MMQETTSSSHIHMYLLINVVVFWSLTTGHNAIINTVHVQYLNIHGHRHDINEVFADLKWSA